jgi:RNA polymerase subunit RPABC4/transcription elongation factor Spt4
LEECVRARRDIMAAVVVGVNGRVWAAYPSPAAAYPGGERLEGMDLTPWASSFPFGPASYGPPGGPPGGPYGAYGPGYGPSGMPGGPGGPMGPSVGPYGAYGPGYGPGGMPGGYPGYPPGVSPPPRNRAPAPYFADPMLRSPEVEERLRTLMVQPRPPDAPGWTPRMLVEPIYNRQDPSILIGRLFVLPQWNESALASAAFHMDPFFVIGAVLSLVLYWLMLPWWVYLDARPRTEKAVPLAIFVLLTNFLGWLTYLVIRPEADRICPVCVTLLEPGFRLCPHCGWSGALRCRQCGRGVRSDWRFCPYCEMPRTEVDQASTQLAAPPGPASSA